MGWIAVLVRKTCTLIAVVCVAACFAQAASALDLNTVTPPPMKLQQKPDWAGFYFLKDGELVVGPFQGKPACVRIALGRGVCGPAAATGRTLLVPDVHEFPGHIACDAASRSEVVVPLLRGATLLGVLDIDSPQPARFDADDARGLEAIAAAFLAGTRA